MNELPVANTSAEASFGVFTSLGLKKMGIPLKQNGSKMAPETIDAWW